MSYKFHNEQDCDWDNDIDFDCNYDYDYVTDSDYYYVCRHKCDFDCNLILIVKVTILPWLTLCLWLKIEFYCVCVLGVTKNLTLSVSEILAVSVIVS